MTTLDEYKDQQITLTNKSYKSVLEEKAKVAATHQSVVVQKLQVKKMRVDFQEAEKKIADYRQAHATDLVDPMDPIEVVSLSGVLSEADLRKHSKVDVLDPSLHARVVSLVNGIQSP